MAVHGPGKSDRPSPLALHSERIPAPRGQEISRSPGSGKTPSRQPLRAASLALTGPGPESAANGFRGRERIDAPDASPHFSEETPGPANWERRWRRYRDGLRAVPSASARRTPKATSSLVDAAGREKSSLSSAALRRRSARASGIPRWREIRLISSRSTSGRRGASSIRAGTGPSFADTNSIGRDARSAARQGKKGRQAAAVPLSFRVGPAPDPEIPDQEGDKGRGEPGVAARLADRPQRLPEEANLFPEGPGLEAPFLPLFPFLVGLLPGRLDHLDQDAHGGDGRKRHACPSRGPDPVFGGHSLPGGDQAFRELPGDEENVLSGIGVPPP